MLAQVSNPVVSPGLSWGWVMLPTVLLVILWLRHRSVQRNIRHLARLVEALANGQTDLRADPTIGGPLGRMARVLNTFTARRADDRGYLELVHLQIRTLMNQVEELVILTDERDRIKHISTAAARLFQRENSQLQSLPLADLSAQNELLDLYDLARSQRETCTRELRINAPGQSLHAAVSVVPLLRAGSYLGSVMVIRDLTQISAAIQMKTDFVANASHELRTPLASIRAAVETITDGGGDDPATVQRCVEIIGGHALRLEMLVQDLLDLSRTEDPRSIVRGERIDLGTLIENTLSLYRPLAGEKNIALHVVVAEEARTLRSDARLLALILKNLLDNALKFTAAGSITVRARLQQPVASRSRPGMPMLFVLEVTDTGCGIPAEDQQRVFERFYTVNRARGGAVALESEQGRGTTLRITFPYRESLVG